MSNITQDMYVEGRRLIPGGNLFSKRPEQFAPLQWPAYYKQAKGVVVTDYDNKEYIDMSTNGIGACILGYADEDVDKMVIRAIQSGQSSSLNCYEDVELAKLLIYLHPWASQVRYTRSGGEAIAVAIRIAQQKTGRRLILHNENSYHGWHFNNPITGEKYMFDGGKEPPAALLIEPRRLKDTTTEELQKIRDHCTKYNIILIFDEITTGFRFNVGGVHLAYNVNPDIVVFAKAISNGYPMGVVLGTSEVMSACQDTFISSTSWTERIGSSAALASITKIWAEDIPDHLKIVGEVVQNIWRQVGAEVGLNVTISGPPQLSHLAIDNGGLDRQVGTTLYTQEMLKRGFLAGRDFYPSGAHMLEHLGRFKQAVQGVFESIASGQAKLEGPVAHSGFQRLT